MWFEGEIRGRGVYRVRTVSRVRIVMWRDGLRERLGGEGGKKAKRDEIEKFKSAQCALWVHSKIFSKGGLGTRLIDNGILIWH